MAARGAFLFVVATALVPACSTSPKGIDLGVDQRVVSPDAGGSGLSWNEKVTFTPCAQNACAEVNVPADWSNPSGPTIRLFLERVRAEGGKKALWLLLGGPGVPAWQAREGAAEVVKQIPGTTVYLLDHRGTGRSTRLSCPQEDETTPGGKAITEAEWPACIEHIKQAYKDTLQHFTTTNAAKDVAWLIDQTRTPGEVVHVRGASYGTLWAQRYIQVFPNHAHAVTLHGTASPLWNAATYDAEFEKVGRAYLTLCASDPFCTTKLGTSDVLQAMADAYRIANDGSCVPGVSIDLLRARFAMLAIVTWHERVLMLAVAHRFRRCNAGDKAALQFAFGPQGSAAFDAIGRATPRPGDGTQSTILFNHILLSEWFPSKPPSLAELQNVHDKGFFSPGASLRLRQRFDTWPRYPKDAFANKLATSDVPLLIIEGTLDPATPKAGADEVAASFRGPKQHYFMLPNATHGTASPTSGGTDCAVDLFIGWMKDHERRPPDCSATIIPVDFAGTTALAEKFFGRTSLWD